MKKIWPQQIQRTKIKMEIYADCAQFGGWNPLAKSFDPISFQEAVTAFGFGTQTQYVLDCITLAVEAHFFSNRETLKETVFASEDDFDAFCTALSKYDWWLNERHTYAFAVLLNNEEFTIRTYADLAVEFHEAYAKSPLPLA